MHDTLHSTSTSYGGPAPPHPVDNADWLKTAAIIAVLVDHFGYFFTEDDIWWSVFGRLAAPTFFFLIGYAQTRTVPLRWIWLGVILTVLESSNANWTWVAPNILLSLALIRTHGPTGKSFCNVTVGPRSPPHFRTFGGIADNGQHCRLRLRGMAVGPVRLMPAHECRQSISYRRGCPSPKLGTAPRPR